MSLSLRKFEDQKLSDGTDFTFDFGGTLQQSIVGIAYFKLSYGEDHSYELNKMAMTLSTTPTGNAGTSVKTTVTAVLEDDDHSIDLGESYVSLSAIGVTGSGEDFNAKLGTQSNIKSGDSETKICGNASEPVQTSAVMMSGFSMAYSTDIHRFWYAQTTLKPTDRPADGLYASITGYCEDDDNNTTDENSFDLIGMTVSTAETPPFLVQTWKGQKPDTDVTVDFSEILQPGYVIDSVRVFIADFKAIYADGGIGSTDHEITAIGAGCKKWDGAGNTAVTLTKPGAFVYQTGHGDDKQDNDTSYVKLVIVATQRPG
ncbi:hypothetical protein [Poseidonocella sp. HB161398]|uniref:hypothetical protein n=1 Tax=Poseidonocella sp. HB161398 TaxID=2320855 RepID=UPI001109C493|nr:hypothetical protein [Poseidonocella sp. HB161398]